VNDRGLSHAAAAWRGAGPATLALLVAGCAASPPAEWAGVREVTPPFLVSARAAQPALAADEHGRVALTWVTRDTTGSDAWLSISSDAGATFSPPLKVNPSAGGVISFPENRPLAVLGAEGRLAVVWCERRAAEPEAADILVRASGDGGATLGAPVVVNDDAADTRPTFHGFPTLTFLPDGALLAVWMDQRDNRRKPGDHGEPTSGSLYYAQSTDGGQTWSDNRRLTDRACPCCRAVATADSSGRVAVAYRAAGGNLRDPALAVSTDHGHTFGLDTLFSADGWLLEGCPAIGPALTWNGGDGGLYVWYTEAGAPGVYAAPWTPEQGRTGVRRSLTDGLLDASHPRSAAFGPATLIAVEARPRADSASHVLAVRELDEHGTLTPWTLLGAEVENGWIAAAGPAIALACWSERREGGTRVRVVQIAPRKAGRA
jgi:hypothetical protein